MPDHLAAAVAKAARFLVSRQDTDGGWRDYDDIPIGASDGWVTAYVGRFLAAEGVTALVPAATAAARRAAGRLAKERPWPAGFGYNRESGPDADSTAHTLTLFRKVGLPVAADDVNWLLARWQPNGGCATYDCDNAWGIAHICVTPVAWLALPPTPREQIGPAVLGFILTCRDTDGTWPAYWWRGRAYSTYWNRRALAELAPAQLRHSAAPAPDLSTVSAFELAHALGAAVLIGQPHRQLLDVLLATQQADGSWAGTANLRVTDPECFRPWERPLGQYYADNHHLITTAGVLGVLVRLLTQP